MINRVILPVEQVENYVRRQLSRGDKLARFLSRTAQLNPGGFVFLPANGPELPTDLCHGGVITSRDAALARDRLAEFIGHYLAIDPASAAVFEGEAVTSINQPKSVAKFVTNAPSDVAIWRAPDFTHPVPATSIYYVADSPKMSTDQIQATVSSARGYPRIGILTLLAEGNLMEHAEISDSVLQQLANDSRYLILGAFDEEVDLVIPLGRKKM